MVFNKQRDFIIYIQHKLGREINRVNLERIMRNPNAQFDPLYFNSIGQELLNFFPLHEKNLTIDLDCLIGTIHDLALDLGLSYETELFAPILFQDDFEEDRGWTYYETYSGLNGGYVEDQYVSPTHSYRLEKPQGVYLPTGGSYCEIRKTFYFANETYNIQVYNRRYTNSGEGLAWARLLFDGTILWSKDCYIDRNVWELVDVNVTPEAGEHTVRLRWQTGSGGLNGTWYFRTWWDDIKIEQIS